MCGGMCFGYTLKGRRKTKEWKEEEEDSNHPLPSHEKNSFDRDIDRQEWNVQKKFKNLKNKN